AVAPATAAAPTTTAASSHAAATAAAPTTETASSQDPTSKAIPCLINGLTHNQALETDINSCIINEEELADDASPALLSLRRNIRRIRDSIKDKLNDIVRSPKYQKFMQDSVVTMRQDRYVVPVKQEFRSEMPGLIHDISASGATVFIEPMAVVNANNEIKGLVGKERIEIQKILARLTSDVCEMLAELRINIDNLAVLDFLFAKGKLSLDMNGSMPAVGKNVDINIKKGRHPLIPKSEVVPTDFWTSEGVRTVVITGPNTGGKTVVLKTVGLLTLMAQAGLNIPAAFGSSLRIFEKVYADIGDEQSIEQSLSTFSSHMTNIVRIMGDADDKTLALFDEIGAGTDPVEGAALATAILECLHQTGTYSIATTHYSELKLYALTTQGVENACCEFDVATLRPTFKLLIGVPGKSNAFAISERLGLPSYILSRAGEFLTQENVKFEDVLLSIEKNREKAEKERVGAEILRRETEELKKNLEMQKGKLEAQKEAILKEGRENARKYLLDIRGEVNQTLKSLRALEEEGNTEQGVKAAEALRRSIKAKLDSVEAEMTESVLNRNRRPEATPTPTSSSSLSSQPQELRAGDAVLILNLNQRGTVLKAPDKNGDALVQAGIMSITSHISNLEILDEQREYISSINLAASSATVSKTMDIRSEIDVRGTRLEEAISQVDKYIDDVILTGLSAVTIIHGKGTGALRSGIQKYLRGNKFVKSFRDGAYGEGDSGITVVELKR
ncbi:MAG: endonuclease MutS2, partial [Oscillospiraceae bacterium]|nr:endonuclease MutS2 [Oscillospiraceae bacterium]